MTTKYQNIIKSCKFKILLFLFLRDDEHYMFECVRMLESVQAMFKYLHKMNNGNTYLGTRINIKQKLNWSQIISSLDVGKCGGN